MCASDQSRPELSIAVNAMVVSQTSSAEQRRAFAKRIGDTFDVCLLSLSRRRQSVHRQFCFHRIIVNKHKCARSSSGAFRFNFLGARKTSRATKA
jgi:hypothetical protein